MKKVYIKAGDKIFCYNTDKSKTKMAEEIGGEISTKKEYENFLQSERVDPIKNLTSRIEILEKQIAKLISKNGTV